MTPRRRPGRTCAGPLVLAVLALAAALAGCGGSSDGVAVTVPGGSATSLAAAPTELVVTADDGAGTTTTWRLTCAPDGGDHPDPAGACAVLARDGATALLPTPADQACTMIYGGPQRATVTGTWRGEPVDATFDRTNGCEIARWQTLVPLLPAAS